MSLTPDQVTAEWLTTVLHAHGHLRGERVASLTASWWETPPSFVAHLQVTYCSGPGATPPTRLFLKLSKPHKLAAALREVCFYKEVAPVRLCPLVPCYAAEGSAESGQAFLLLGDVSHSHPAIEVTPTARQLELIVDACATMHAAWWDHPDLTAVAGQSAEAAFLGDFAGNERRYAELLDLHGSRIPDDWRRLYESAFRSAPNLMLDRVRKGQGLTLCHPDSHAGNYLVCRSTPPSGVPAVYVIDWHQYRVWWGAKDLTKLFSFSIPDQYDRQTTLLHRYLKTLQECRVSGYGWKELRADYQLALVDYLFQPLGNRNMPWGCSEVGRAVGLFRAWSCEGLLGPAL